MNELQKEYEDAEKHYLLTGNYAWMADVGYRLMKFKSISEEMQNE